MGHLKYQFYNNPIKSFQIRELSRITGIPKSTVALKIKKMVEEGTVIEENEGVFKSYKADYTSFKHHNEKKAFALKEILESGLIEYLEDTLFPKSITLFGSMAKGEYTKDSDIDLFIECSDRDIDVSEFEEKLKKPIQIFMSPSIKDIGPRLANNILNGIKVSGFIKFFQN